MNPSKGDMLILRQKNLYNFNGRIAASIAGIRALFEQLGA